MTAHEKQAAKSSACQIDIVPQWLRPLPAAKYASMCRARLYQAISAGKLKSHLVGGCRLIHREELDRFIAGHPAC